MPNLRTWSELEAEGMSDIDIRKARLAICDDCPKMLEDGHCSLCYCAISSMTARPNARCPLRKW